MTCKTCVITVNFKGAEDTALCVDSLHRSITPVDVVVVDNTPGDPELTDALEPFEAVNLIKAPQNLGFGRGNNLGIDWALKSLDCEYFLILNNDATVRPETVGNLESAMDSHPEAGVLASRIVLAEDETRLWYGGGEVDWRRGAGRVPGVLGASDAPLAMKGRYVSFASGCAMMFRRRVLDELGGFDSRFFMYEEDLEISLRVQEKGWKIWYEPGAVISHIGQGSQDERTKFIGRYHPNNPNLAFLVYHGFKNCLLNMNIHAKGWHRVQFYCFFPFFFGMKCVHWALRRRIDAVGSAFGAVKDFLKEC